MITLARDGMQTDLERIWKLCFGTGTERFRYFFDNRYNPNRCVVYIDETVGHPVAMLHMLDASITEDSEIIPVQYLCAAAVRPDYRGRGIMRALVDYSRRVAQAERIRYQVVVPGSKELFRYSESMGFYRCFKIRSVYMSRKDLTALSDVRKYPTAKGIQGLTLSLNDINAVRRDLLVDREGFITWDYQAVKYAVGLHEFLGGLVITATNGFEAGYAMCMPSGDNRVSVTEMISHPDFEGRVIRNILRTYTQENFEFKLPVYPEFFSRFGQVDDYGMIYAVNGRKPINILTLTGTHTPYLGLDADTFSPTAQ